MRRRVKIILAGVVILAAVILLGGWYSYQQQQQKLQEQYQFPTPAEMVVGYFTAWNNQDYPVMYATISDGFKKIDLSAQNLAAFKQYVQSQPITGVTIILVAEKSNDGATAMVGYEVEFAYNHGQRQPYSGTFTLKNRQGDVIRGWKLIHPYG